MEVAGLLEQKIACHREVCKKIRLGEALAPFLWITGCMKHGVDCHRGLPVFEKDGIWKASHQGPAIRLMDESVKCWLPANAFHTGVNRTQELLAQPNSATLVPDVSLRNIEFCFQGNNNANGHTWRAPVASHPPRIWPRRGLSAGSPFSAPVPVFASHGRAQPLASPQGHPTDPPPVGASRTGLNQKLTAQVGSFDSPSSILSKFGPSELSVGHGCVRMAAGSSASSGRRTPDSADSVFCSQLALQKAIFEEVAQYRRLHGFVNTSASADLFPYPANFDVMIRSSAESPLYERPNGTIAKCSILGNPCDTP
jgi:hypothetical protein